MPTNTRYRRSSRRWLRRGGVVVQVAVMSTVIMGFGALAVDVGVLYASKSELQAAADSAALAAAAQLSGDIPGSPIDRARDSAVEYAEKHIVFGDPIQLDPSRDVEPGKAILNPNSGRYEFVPASYNHDAVRVTVRRTADSPGGAIPLMFANVLGMSEKDMWASASAVLIPRDIAVVIDISNSMCWDSELRYWNRTDGGYTNLRDVWAALDGPEPSRPYLPGSELETEYAGDTGPAFGMMSDWGNALIPGAYSITSDPGLIYLPRGSKWHADLTHFNVLESWAENQANNDLVAQGYDVWERWALLTNECEGYLTAPATNVLGFTSRAIWKLDSSTGRNRITVYFSSDGTGSTPSLSNIQVSVPPAALATALATASSQGGYPVLTVNPDPHTGLIGIKWEGTCLGESGGVETEWFSFEVPNTVPVTGASVGCKAGATWTTVSHTFQNADRYESTRWRLRTGTVLGLNTWLSGLDGESQGDSDGLIEGDSEVTWLALPSFAVDWNWKTYIDYVRSSTNPSGFRCRYGPKTLTDYLMEYQPESYSTSNLWATPEQPLRATKDAVQTMVDVIAALDSMDHMSLEIFAATARHQVNLSENLQEVADVLYERQSGHWDRSTNLGGGLATAIAELKSSRARSSSAKVIVLMSDGVPNITESGEYVSDGDPAAVQYALDQADIARQEGFRVYCVSVGYSVDREVMQAIAAKANGQEFYAAGSPEEYTEQLEDIFRSLGGKRPVALIE